MKVAGLVIHCGYVETGKPGVIFLASHVGVFDNEKKALEHLSNYLLEDYLDEFESKYCKRLPTLDDFHSYLTELPAATASAGGPAGHSWDGSHMNGEKWWPWYTIYELLPHLKYFVEINEPIEQVVPHFLDLNNIKNKEFKKELEEIRKDPTIVINKGLFTRLKQKEKVK